MHCLKERRLFDSDGGGGGGAGDTSGPDESIGYSGLGGPAGDTAASQDAAAEGVGGGTGPGGVAAPADFDVSPDISLDFAAPADPTNPGIAAPTQEQDVAFGSQSPGQGATSYGINVGAPGYDPNQTFIQNLRSVSRELSPFSNPNPTNIGRFALGFANPAFSTLGVLGLGLNALGATPGTDVDAYGAPVGEVGGAGDAGIGSQGQAGGDYGNIGFQPLGGGLVPPSEQQVASTGPQYQRPTRIEIPASLKPYVGEGMTDLQLRTAIATNALYNTNPAYRTQEVKDFYDNLVTRALIDDVGNFNDFSALTPVEQQYVLQSRGIQGYDPDAKSFLRALGTIS